MNDRLVPERTLQLLDTTPTAATGGDAGGCGCGGCGCGSATGGTTSTEAPSARSANQGRTTQTYSVTGMTCGHCASAVTGELTRIDGVTDVEVHLVAGGTSVLTVVSSSPLDDVRVAAALDEAGGYQLA